MSDLAAYEFVVANISDGLYRVDLDRTITAWNPAAAVISGFSVQEVIGRRCRDGILNHVDHTGRHLCRNHCPLAATMTDGQPREALVWLTRADGSRLPVRIRAVPTRDADGTITGAIELFADATASRNAQARREELTRTQRVDPITGLGTDPDLTAHLTILCDACTREGWASGVLLIEPDHLAAITHEHGSAGADRTLTLVARTLTQTLPDNARLVRYNEHQFAVLQPCVDGDHLARNATLLQRMIAVSRLDLDGHRVRVTATIAATMIEPNDTPDAVLRRAQNNLSAARQSDAPTWPPCRPERCQSAATTPQPVFDY